MKTKKYSKLFLAILCIFCALPLYAMDIGVILDQTASVDSYGSDDSVFEYAGTLIPRFSTSLGDSGEIYVSAGLTVQADSPKSDAPVFVPELLRTEFSQGFGWGNVKAGRIYYADPLGFIAAGLFDGAAVSVNTEFGSFNAGAWYTGLLYKDRANITMTQQDLQDSADAGLYFASSRFLAALGWEHPNLVDMFRARAAFIGQFDVSGNDDYVHSQYLAAKITMPVKMFVIDLGGCLELIQLPETSGVALAGEVGLSWMFFTPLGKLGAANSQLSLLGRFSSGVSEDGDVYAFLPLSTVSQGDILQEKFSGISMISLNYTARLLHNLSASFSSSYFVRSDLGTYMAYPVSAEDNAGYALGNEFFLKAYYNPASDVQVTLGAGVFLPAMGDVAPNADVQWRMELNVVLSIY